MERSDVKKTSYGVGRAEFRHDEVTFIGNGREAELIIAGLRTLRGAIAIRDVTVGSHQVGGDPVLFPEGAPKRRQGEKLPLFREVDVLIESITSPNFADPSQS